MDSDERTYYDKKESDADNVSAKDDPTYAKLFSMTGIFDYHGRRCRWDYLKIGVITTLLQNSLKKVPVIHELIMVVVVYVIFTNTSKRLHDIDKPTSWAIALAILDSLAGIILELTQPSFGAAMLALVALSIPLIPRIILLCIKGTDGPNQYGPDPLAMEEK